MRVKPLAVVLASSALAFALGCTEHEPELGRVGAPIPEYEAGSLYTCTLDGGIDTTCEPPAGDTAGAQIPCAVDAVLGPTDPSTPVEDRRCRRCHNEPQENGAPFPLLTYADTQITYATKPLWKKMYENVCKDFMPYCANASCGPLFEPTVKPLTPGQKATLLEWLSCPKPVFDVSCE